METIFSGICDFILANKASIASSVIARATYDGLKKVLDFSSLKQRIKGFFQNEEEAEQYVEIICNEESLNTAKPYRDIEDSYEKLTGQVYREELYKEIEQWIKEHSEQIVNVSKMNFQNERGFNIGTQNAGNNIYNIQGDYKPKK
ncbi:hypothetical protein [Dysgonomonas sp.]|uniref:hypothetical protein n=1 Tax=Dysgonomonas sp. TaxID=1891233 RepID=UPI0027BA9017|nr:hypothetical protein [Dysgonomonas sp.]